MRNNDGQVAHLLEKRAVALVIRYDDFFGTEPNPRPTADLRRVEMGLSEIHARPDLPAVFAAVPAGVGESADDRALVEAVKRSCDAGTELALHGFNHENTLTLPASSGARAWARFCRRTRAEFGGMAHDEQARRMSRGRAMLQERFGLPVTTFVPPWNAYDAGTVEAASQAGITAISASRAWPVPGAPGIAMLPQTVGAAGLEDAVAYALRRARPAAVVCVTHVWDFALEERPGCITLASWESRLRALGANEGVVVTTVRGLNAAMGERLTAGRLRRNRVLSGALRVAGTVAGRRAVDLRRAVYSLV